MCLVGSRHHDALEYTILHLKCRDFILHLLELVFPFTFPRGFFPSVTCFCAWESSVDLSGVFSTRMSVNADIGFSHFVLPKDTNCLRSFLDWFFTELVISIILIKTTENNLIEMQLLTRWIFSSGCLLVVWILLPVQEIRIWSLGWIDLLEK